MGCPRRARSSRVRDALCEDAERIEGMARLRAADEAAAAAGGFLSHWFWARRLALRNRRGSQRGGGEVQRGAGA